jgi:sulfite dehydrogenase (quinone) subunit SoeC
VHPAFSVIFLTTLIGAGQGLFLALFTAQVYGAFSLLPHSGTSGFYAVGSLMALILLALGLVASLFHLGHPERGWRSIACWRTSWLSREVIALPAFMAALFLYGAAHYFGLTSPLLVLGDGLGVDLTLIFGVLATLLCFVLFLCTAMIYACLKFLQEWATPLTPVNYLLLGSASGFTLASAYAAASGSSLAGFFAGWAIILTVAGFLSRGVTLLRNARLKRGSSLQTAIGIKHPQIAQKAQGAMGGSFNTREFFHGQPATTLAAVKWAFLALAFLVPVCLLGAGIGSGSAVMLTLAFAVQYLGLLAERWHFFAQARHPQNLYYQTVA